MSIDRRAMTARSARNCAACARCSSSSWRRWPGTISRGASRSGTRAAELAELGLDRTLALQIIGDLPAGSATTAAAHAATRCWRGASSAVRAAGAAQRCAGAGGTTGQSARPRSSAKLAARYVLEHDAANLALVSADDERIGAQEQLRSLGQLLGVRVETPVGLSGLATRIEALPGRMMLIDTPGAASRDLPQPRSIARCASAARHCRRCWCCRRAPRPA